MKMKPTSLIAINRTEEAARTVLRLLLLESNILKPWHIFPLLSLSAIVAHGSLALNFRKSPLYFSISAGAYNTVEWRRSDLLYSSLLSSYSLRLLYQPI